MMTKYRVVFIGVMLAALSSCGMPPRYTDRPVPTRFESTGIPKLQSASHWQIIADNFAHDVAADLRQKNIDAPIYIPGNQAGFAFVEGFIELLTTSLVTQGMDVRTCTQRGPCGDTNTTDGIENALVLDVRYSAYAFQPKDIYYTGEMTSLAAGLLAVGGIAYGGGVAHRPVSHAGKLLGVAMLTDTAFWAARDFDTGPDGKYMRGVPATEILLTASVTQGDKIVVRRSNVYFTSDEDDLLYWQKRGGKTVPVKGEE
ncbi:MAG: hypothetical protein LBI59_00375 [Candidatus Accumulibacter sp.]|nr:hypothetical protein [Accumulibacter sp.]